MLLEAIPVDRSTGFAARSASTCPTFLAPPRPQFSTSGGTENLVDIVWQPLDRQVDTVGGKSFGEHRAFDLPAGRFGRSFTVRKRITEGGPNVRLPDQVRRSHTYTMIFRRCARGGRVPRGC